MKYLSFVVALLAVGSLSLGAQPKTDSLPTAQNAQIETLQTEVADLRAELKEHRIREEFYSDVLGAHGTWCGILIALLGAGLGTGVGFISWSKVKNAKDEVKREFDVALKEHKEADEKFREAVTRDRFNLMTMADNLYVQQGNDCIDKGDISDGIFFLYVV